MLNHAVKKLECRTMRTHDQPTWPSAAALHDFNAKECVLVYPRDGAGPPTG